MDKNPNARILDPHAESRSYEWRGKSAAAKLMLLVGKEQAQEIARECIQNSFNDYGLSPKVFANLMEAKLNEIRTNAAEAQEIAASEENLDKLRFGNRTDFQRYCHIKNVVYYSKKGYTDDTYLLQNILKNAGYGSVAECKLEFPHLWIEEQHEHNQKEL